MMIRETLRAASAFKAVCAVLLLMLAGAAHALLMQSQEPQPPFDPAVVAVQETPAVSTMGILNPAGPPFERETVARANVIEPGTLALLGLGLVIVGITTSSRARRRPRKSDEK